MTARALRKIEAELSRIASDPDEMDRDALKHLARQIGAQAEMIEEGLEP